MRVAILALLLLANVANAQWVSPVEQSYGPYPAPAIGADAAAVASKTGVLLAWSEVDPLTGISGIRAALLDFDGRLVSPIRDIPPYQAAASAHTPVAATNGESFAIAWNEGPIERRAAVSLGADGTPLSAPLLQPVQAKYSPPLLLWLGDSFYVGGLAFDALGQPVSPPPVLPPQPRYAADDTVVGVKWASHGDEWRYVFGAHTAIFFPAELSISWSFVRGVRSEIEGSKLFHYHAPDPVVAGDSDEAAIVWTAPDGITGLRTFDDSFRLFHITGESVVPEGIAFDGERWLVVFTRGQNIWGAFVDRSTRSADPFPISTTDRSESRAHVAVLQPGRFLVWYASDGADGHRFAGRIVLASSPTKTRAVRP